METGSGSKLNAQKSDAERLAGQYRLICDQYKEEYPSTTTKGRNNCRPNWLNGTNTLKLETDASKTPQYSIALSDLFPGMYSSSSFQLPCGLIQQEILLDINFSRNGALGNNDRAIFCPSLSTQTKSSIISLGLQQAGEGTGGAQTDLVLANPTSNLPASTGTDLKIMVDLDASGVTTNLRIIDGGNGYIAGERLTFAHADLQTQNLIVVPAFNFTEWDSDSNFYVDAGNQGANYVLNDTYTVAHPTNPDLNFKITATAVNAGALESGELASVEDNNNMSLNSDYDEPYDVEGGAKIYVVKDILTITNTAGAGAFVIGDVVQVPNEAENQAVVIAIDANDRPTTLHVIKGAFDDGDDLEKESDHVFNRRDHSQ